MLCGIDTAKPAEVAALSLIKRRMPTSGRHTTKELSKTAAMGEAQQSR